MWTILVYPDPLLLMLEVLLIHPQAAFSSKQSVVSLKPAKEIIIKAIHTHLSMPYKQILIITTEIVRLPREYVMFAENSNAQICMN